MQYDPFFSGAYHLEKQLEHSTYSVLGLGKKLETGLPVMLRLWFTAHATTTAAQERIQAEVATLQQILHPHLLPLLEVRASARGVFLVSMQAACGSLHERLQHQLPTPLPFEEALQLIQQVGQALHALHQQGIIHGNLTPQAIFFNAPGHARLGEFRVKSILACLEDYQPALDESVPRCWYMAPEEFHGMRSAWSDQYALGCLSYLLLTGQVPFAGAARATLLQKHHRDHPTPPGAYTAALPLHVEHALFKALAKHPAERYSSIQDFLEALEEPQRIAIAEQDTLAHAFDAPLLDQEAGEPTPFVAAREEVALAMPAEETFAGSAEPVTAATWSRIRVSGVTPRLPTKPEGRRHPARRSVSSRGRFVLLALVCLVLVSVCAAGGWLVFAGGPKPLRPNSVVTTLANAQAATTVPSTQNPSLSPTLSPSSTSVPAPTQPGFVGITPFVDCVTATGGSLVAHFGYQNAHAFAVTVPLGRANVVSPSNLNGSQPVSFAPGSQHAVFQVTFFKRQTVTWSLEGSTATASSNSPHC